MRARFGLSLVLPVLASTTLLAGCPAPLAWTTPRTIPKGTISHTVGVEVMRFDELEAMAERADPEDAIDWNFTMAFPAYLVRIGIADMFDIGVKGSTSGTVVADFKLQLVRSEFFDLALDPSYQFSILNYAMLPIMFGVNAGEIFQFFLAPRAGYMFVIASFEGTNSLTVWGGSAGLRLGVTEGFAVVAEAAVIRPIDQDLEFFNQITFGIGFSFGDGQPDYGEEVEAGVAPPPPPSAPPPPPPAGPPIVQ